MKALLDGPSYCGVTMSRFSQIACPESMSLLLIRMAFQIVGDYDCYSPGTSGLAALTSW